LEDEQLKRLTLSDVVSLLAQEVPLSNCDLSGLDLAGLDFSRESFRGSRYDAAEEEEDGNV
jgi:uncharacterized protein YjbI with pentapeptide repeats